MKIDTIWKEHLKLWGWRFLYYIDYCSKLLTIQQFSQVSTTGLHIITLTCTAVVLRCYSSHWQGGNNSYTSTNIRLFQQSSRNTVPEYTSTRSCSGCAASCCSKRSGQCQPQRLNNLTHEIYINIFFTYHSSIGTTLGHQQTDLNFFWRFSEPSTKAFISCY